MQQNMMKYMTIFFGLMFYKVAAGLCMYFIASSLWGVAERKLLPKKKPPGPVVPAAGTTSSTAITGKPPAPYGKGKAKIVKKEKEDENTLEKIKSWWKEVLRQAEKK